MDNLVTSNIRQRPIRTLVSVAGIALGVCLVMLFTGLARGMSNDLARRAANVRAELIFMRPGAIQATGASMNLDVEYVNRLKAIEGIEDAIPINRRFPTHLTFQFETYFVYDCGIGAAFVRLGRNYGCYWAVPKG